MALSKTMRNHAEHVNCSRDSGNLDFNSCIADFFVYSPCTPSESNTHNHVADAELSAHQAEPTPPGGWGASLANHFSRTGDVVLRGYSGYNTRWALKVLEKVFPATQDGDGGINGAPLAITVFFGANDACLPDRYGAFQHVPLLEYKLNLHSIVSFFKKRWPTTHVLLITPPPIDENARVRNSYADNPQGLPERTNEAAGEYARACIAVAEECGVTVIDLWTKMQQRPDWKDYLCDGLHLSQSGNRVVFEEVIMKLKDKGSSLESMPVDLPLIDDIDPNDPLKSFQ